MDHHRSSYRARHRRIDSVGPAPWRAAGGREPKGAGFSPRSILVLVVLALMAIGAWVPFALGRAGADTLETANGSPASIQSHPANSVEATSVAADPSRNGEASRSERRQPVPGSSTALAAATPTVNTSASAVASPSVDSVPVTTETATPGSLSQVAGVVELVNDARAEAGCDPLHSDPRLDAAALAHSEDMIVRDYFSHVTPDGVSPWDRAKAAGYDVPTGENIALGQRDADTVMTAWMSSEGHRANILNCASKAIGMGLALDSSGTPYWTQMFGAF